MFFFMWVSPFVFAPQERGGFTHTWRTLCNIAATSATKNRRDGDFFCWLKILKFPDMFALFHYFRNKAINVYQKITNILKKFRVDNDFALCYNANGEKWCKMNEASAIHPKYRRSRAWNVHSANHATSCRGNREQNFFGCSWGRSFFGNIIEYNR